MLCGVAARALPARVTDIAVAGSPGMRADNAAAAAAPAPGCGRCGTRDDWIQDVPNLEVGGLGHGADPVVRRASARGCCRRAARDGHSGYFEPGTESLRQLRRDRRRRVPRGARAPRDDDACRDGSVR